MSNSPLLALLTAGFYILFTLLPDSHSLMVQWPWVFIWQIALLCPYLWLLTQGLSQRCWPSLGKGWDRLLAAAVVIPIGTSLTAQSSLQAIWQVAALLGLLAALYALAPWLQTPQQRQRLLAGQGYLSLAFILVSLFLWLTQTYFPEAGRLQALRAATGLALPFDFSELSQRNWAPMGHQNYVAGYLMLALPLLVGLGLSRSGKQRWFWAGGAVLGLIDLYTTSSRAGWLALIAGLVVTLIELGRRQMGRRLAARTWGLAIAGVVTLLTLGIFTTGRWQAVLAAVQNGQIPGDLVYRLITLNTGWAMGLAHWATGVGLGNVPLSYQRYRPLWAGRESELAYQLHSTPIQLWAELGIWGPVLMLGGMGLLMNNYRRWQGRTLDDAGAALPRPLTASLYVGLLAYMLQSLTDYQLDNLSISGSLVMFVAVLIAENRPVASSAAQRWPIGRGLLLLIPLVAAAIILTPVHRAWSLSSQGFTAFNTLNSPVNKPSDALPATEQATLLQTFEQSLNQAQQLAPKEPYYGLLAAWGLADQGLKRQAPQLLDRAIATFQAANQTWPHQEFGHSNLGWLLLQRDPAAASRAFAQAIRLVPAKHGLFYGLGTSLLAQGKTEPALDAFTVEILRDPLFLSSPIWQQPPLQALYPQLIQRILAKYQQLINQSTSPELTRFLQHSRAGVRWWTNDFAGAKTDAPTDSPLQIVAALATGQPVAEAVAKLPESALKLTLLAWLQPERRSGLLRQAWILGHKSDPPPDLLSRLQTTMDQSPSFEVWVKQQVTPHAYRRERAGFGVLSRHTDGPVPSDLGTVVDNVAMKELVDLLLPSAKYYPPIDLALDADRAALLKTIPA
jgi:uncharacterized protein involved in response to NO